MSHADLVSLHLFLRIVAFLFIIQILLLINIGLKVDEMTQEKEEISDLKNIPAIQNLDEELQNNIITWVQDE